MKVRPSRSREARKIQRARMMHPTGKPIIVPPVFPNAGVAAWYQSHLDAMVSLMYRDAFRVVVPAVREMPTIIAKDEGLTHCAGVMFRCNERILFLKRSDGQGWAFPGGHIEPGETAEHAAIREVSEEIGFHGIDSIVFSHIQAWLNIRFHTFAVECKHEFIPALNYEHTEYVWLHKEYALALLELHPGVRETLQRTTLAVDADPMNAKRLQRALDKWGNQWIERFDLMATSLSLDFAQRNKNATEVAMSSAFNKAGFTVAFKPTKSITAAYKAVAAEQVGLIKSIAQKFHTDIQTQVWESVKRGGDLKTLSKNIEKTYGVTRRRAALIARDQNVKAKATMEAVRHQELGIKQGIWLHSHGGKVPRPAHVKMNNKLYDLSKGMWDEDEQKWVQPGELINCGCTMRPYIPGFEPAMPEWEIVQT